MKRKIKGFIKYHSCILFPLVTYILSAMVNRNFHCFSICNDKASSLVSTASTFIGVLITILTIYLAVPKDESKKQRLIKSGHERIYLCNILMGIIILSLSIFSVFQKKKLCRYLMRF